MSPLVVALLLSFTLDRFEGDVAVLYTPEGTARDVAVASLPADAAPGDTFDETLHRIAPVNPALRRRIERRRARLLALAPHDDLRHRAPVKQRSDHRQDHYFHKAKKEGFAARSVYKLEEIDQRHRILRRGQKVLDLGCAPGSWLQYVARVVGPDGRAIGLDLKPVSVPLPPHVRTLVADAFETPVEALLPEGERFDVVLSDMAPATIGNRFTDHVRSMELCHRVLAVADRTLRPGGACICKAFEGEDIPALAAAFRERFAELKRAKPKGTRTESVEVFFIGVGFKPPAPVRSADADAQPVPVPMETEGDG
jgi:23S rRNA (uridine2552-2'-O)-methyltransferase